MSIKKFLFKTHVSLFTAMFFAINEEDLIYVAFACLVMPILTYYLALADANQCKEMIYEDK